MRKESGALLDPNVAAAGRSRNRSESPAVEPYDRSISAENSAKYIGFGHRCLGGQTFLV